MQLTLLSGQLLPQSLASIAAKFSREPPQLRAGRPWVWADQPPLEPFWPPAWPTLPPPIVDP
jgi:hypothetical protein